jgi:hypothetical protein
MKGQAPLSHASLKPMIFMVRAEVIGSSEPAWDIWFRERAEMDGFLAQRPPQIRIVDIHEREASTAESALEQARERINEEPGGEKYPGPDPAPRSTT